MCRCCPRNVGKNYDCGAWQNPEFIYIVMAGFADGGNITGLDDLNGTWVLPIIDDCSQYQSLDVPDILVFEGAPSFIGGSMTSANARLPFTSDLFEAAARISFGFGSGGSIGRLSYELPAGNGIRHTNWKEEIYSGVELEISDTFNEFDTSQGTWPETILIGAYPGPQASPCKLN